jgi:hypothetical protein
MLRQNFVCGWQNIEGHRGAGRSNGHDPSNPASDVNNGAGFHNVQMLVLTPDGRVVHCLPGYWKAAPLIKELQFSLELVQLWNSSRPLKDKVRQFQETHLEHMLKHSAKDIEESRLPNFDEHRERTRGTDTTRSTGDVKKTDQIVHERMAERPFMPYEEFDLAAFTDVGQKFYDSHTDG